MRDPQQAQVNCIRATLAMHEVCYVMQEECVCIIIGGGGGGG